MDDHYGCFDGFQLCTNYVNNLDLFLETNLPHAFIISAYTSHNTKLIFRDKGGINIELHIVHRRYDLKYEFMSSGVFRFWGL